MAAPPKPRGFESYAHWLAQTGVEPGAPLEFLMFGDEPRLARELAELVAFGPKRATTGLPAAWTSLDEELPAVGQRFIVHDWEGEPLAVIETTRVEVMPLCQVGADFAYAEGEGDRTLAFWQKAHASYFARECPRLGIAFDWNMDVVCVRFRRLFPDRDTPSS
jgi:uncharacterized protein YhfF